MRYSLYFAYGSNMNERQFHERCPCSHFLCRAALPDHRFIITSRGYGNVIWRTGSIVHGVLAALTELDERELDQREGVLELIYRRERLEVITDFGYTIPALIYIDTVISEGPPKDGYLEKILVGARRHQLPPAYLDEIAGWAKKV
ncbi:MAG: gamma-glutamylcyclotransferase family protein [Opitutales bacterium]|jgi:cation transport regulator ChaC